MSTILSLLCEGQRGHKDEALAEILSQSCEIRTKFVRISYEFHIFRIFTHFYSREIRTKFVRISYEFRANLCEFLLIACESQ